MKTLSVFFSIVVIPLLCTSCNAPLRPENKAATNILAAVASGDVDKFNWLSIEDVRSFRACEDRDEIENIVRDKKNILLPALHDWRHEGEGIGIHWSNYTINRVEYEYDYDKSLSVNMANGYIYLISAGNEFKISFKHAIILDNDEWKWIELQDFESVNNNHSSNAETSNTALNQESDFDTFLVSLADCFAAKNYSGCRKVVLTDNKEKPVIRGELSMIDYYVDELGISFKKAVKNKNYSIEEQNPAQLLEWFDGYELDEDELFNKSEVTVLKSGEGLLSGIYFTYKGKWYLWQIF